MSGFFRYSEGENNILASPQDLYKQALLILATPSGSTKMIFMLNLAQEQKKGKNTKRLLPRVIMTK